jgi:hypothetical protein
MFPASEGLDDDAREAEANEICHLYQLERDRLLEAMGTVAGADNPSWWIKVFGREHLAITLADTMYVTRSIPGEVMLSSLSPQLHRGSGGLFNGTEVFMDLINYMVVS